MILSSFTRRGVNDGPMTSEWFSLEKTAEAAAEIEDCFVLMT